MVSLRCRTLQGWTGQPTRRPTRSQFSAGWTATRDLLERELAHLSARNAVLELDAEQTDMRNDGWPYANARVDPPARISFESKHGPLVYQCDRFDRWQDNVRAIALALEALRKVDRYGVSGQGEQYAGWAQIGPESSGLSPLDELADLAGKPRAEAPSPSDGAGDPNHAGEEGLPCRVSASRTFRPGSSGPPSESAKTSNQRSVQA